MAEKMFYDDRANNSSENLGIRKQDTLMLIGNTCICGNCHRKIDHKPRPTACEHSDCGTAWKCIVVELRSRYKDEFDFLPNVTQSVVRGYEYSLPSEINGGYRYRSLGGRAVSDVQFVEGFDKL